MHFQGRGNVYLQEILANGDLATGVTLCTDSFNIAMATESGTHINKCGAVDVEDARFTKSQTCTLTMALADMQDKIFALGVLGTVNAVGSPGTVTNEAMPDDIAIGDVYFLGGKTRHRAITGLTIDGMTVDVDYTLDAASGKLTFLTAAAGSPNSFAAYGYTDPQYVSLFTAGAKYYFLSYEFINKQNANDPGSLELYKVRFDPTDNADFQSDDLQIMTFNGSALADTDRDDDTELGQFGRRIL
jgi:hypothetical protein